MQGRLETAVRLLVSGHVQGVGYRYWARSTASRMDLRGWVRNLQDGRVELLAIGPSQDLDRLVDACRLGPTAATVQEVEVQDLQPPDRVNGFVIQA